MNIADFLAELLQGQGQPQNRMSGNWRGADSAPNRLIQPAQQMAPQMAQQAAPMPQAAPPEAIAQPQAPQQQPDQVQTAAVAPPAAQPVQSDGGGIGGFLGNLFGGGQRAAENQTIQWLQQQGMDPGTATMMAKSKPILQQYLLERSKGKKPIEIAGRLVDPTDYHVLADFSDKAVKGKKRDLTSEEVKARGYPAGSYQVDDVTGDVSTVGGAREQDPTFGREKDIRQEYENSPIVKGYQIVRDNYERIRQGSQLTTGAGDLAIVFGYMKMLDPTSVVREGEQAAATDVSGVPSRIRNLYNSVAAGEKLPPEARAELLAAAQQVYGEASKNLGDLNTRYSGIASQWQLDPARIVQTPETYDPLGATDPAVPTPGAAVAAPAAPGAVAPGGVDLSKMPPPEGISPQVWKFMPPEKRKLWAQ